VTFDASLERSSWLAVRILGSSHTNPIFVLVDGKPIRASRQSAQWCLAAVNQCWTQKAPKISKQELADAQAAYDHAREVYTKLVAECAQQGEVGRARFMAPPAGSSRSRLSPRRSGPAPGLLGLPGSSLAEAGPLNLA